MLDLRGSVFFAHENGSFTEENIPRPGASLSGFRECVSSEKYPLSIRGRGSKNILVSGGTSYRCPTSRAPVARHEKLL